MKELIFKNHPLNIGKKNCLIKCKEKYAENADIQNREIAFSKIFDDVMGKQRKNELDLYRLISQDDGFKIAMQDTIKRMLRP